MTVFQFSKYRFASMVDIKVMGGLGREKHLMRIAQKFFNDRGLQDKVSLGVERDEFECVMRDGEFVTYFFSERGGRNLIALFLNVYKAIDFVSYRHLGVKLPFNWREINRELDRLGDEAGAHYYPD